MGTNYYLRPKLAATVKTYIDGAVVESRRDYSEPRLYLVTMAIFPASPLRMSLTSLLALRVV